MENNKINLKKSYPTFGEKVALEHMTVVHPAVQIYVWICLALVTQILGGPGLMVFATMVIAVSVKICGIRFGVLLRRMRWIFISILLVYAFSGSGDAIFPVLGAYSPILSGIEDGLIQILRLVALLAGLSLLLTLLTQKQLITGVNTLVYPLSFLGLNRTQLSIRLALTMRYAESVMLDASKDWRATIELMTEPPVTTPGFVEIDVVPLTVSDWLLAAGMTALLLGVWL